MNKLLATLAALTASATTAAAQGFAPAGPMPVVAGGIQGPACGTRCTTRPAVGGGAITSCHKAGSAAPAVQFRTREAVGGGTITTGAGRVCVSRPAVGGVVATTCR
jgi:hypothetical protein